MISVIAILFYILKRMRTFPCKVVQEYYTHQQKGTVIVDRILRNLVCTLMVMTINIRTLFITPKKSNHTIGAVIKRWCNLSLVHYFCALLSWCTGSTQCFEGQYNKINKRINILFFDPKILTFPLLNHFSTPFGNSIKFSINTLYFNFES